ncbi:transketolase, thiamine pyrophosphate-binding domain protein [Bordetella pertussis STO1-CHOC-0018]|nr:transketolase, thiamine pyrophosphate-binding domain protein [Bordetella pertussis STO1-CHOC-0018]
MAEIAQALWLGNLRHNPADPAWANRDRFVLSNGHGSMLIYALLHLTGYDLPLEELKNFRQLHSRTPGHPEVGITPGVETTTGPLGQGLANAVGMALAEALLAAEFNRAGHTVVDHHTYVFLGDGCLMEGISHEACSLAGTLKLSKLVALYDDNGISIDGHVEHWFADDTATRFEGYGWNVIRGVDGHDVAAVDAAIKQARAQSEKPTLIVCRTVIGKGSPNMAGTHNVHGAPLGNDEIAATRAALGWSAGPFEVPQDIYAAWDSRPAGALAQAAWEDKFQAYAAQYPAEAAEFTRRMKGELPEGFAARFEAFLQATVAKGETVATRKASQFAIAELAGLLPEMLGGSADLTGSNFTDWKGVAPLRRRPPRRAFRPPYQLRRARVRHGRHHERHRAAWRLPAVRRHLPDVLGLLAQRHPHGGADEAARGARVHARFHRPGRGRSDPPVDRTRRQPAPDSQPVGVAALRHRRDGRRLGRGRDAARPASAWTCTTAVRPRCCCRARTCRSWRATRPRRKRLFAVVTSCATHTTRVRLSSPRARKSPSRWPRRNCWPPTASPCGWFPCPAPTCSTARTPNGSAKCCRPACRAWPSRRA